MHFGRQTTKVVLSTSHGIITESICYQLSPITGDVDLNHLIKVVSPGFFHCKITLSPSVIKSVCFEAMLLSFYFSNFHFLVVAFTDDSFLSQFFIAMLANGDTLFYSSTFTTLKE
jgi:hypothetical protein